MQIDKATHASIVKIMPVRPKVSSTNLTHWHVDSQQFLTSPPSLTNSLIILLEPTI